MVKRRANNEGSIFPHRDGRRWRAAVTIQGRRISKVMNTQKECQVWVKEKLAQAEDGMTVDAAKVTVESYLSDWLETARSAVRPNTFKQYEYIARQYLIPDLGKIKIGELRPDQVQKLYNRKLSEGKGVRTVQLIHAVLHRALNQALRSGLVRRNLCDACDKPKAPKSKMKALDADQVQRLLEAADGNRLAPLLYMAIHTALREGELLGLQWSDLDWEKGTLQIQQQAQWQSGKGTVFVPPKTAAGRRCITLGPDAIAILHQQKAQQLTERMVAGARWQNRNLIFCTTVGTAMNPPNLIKQFRALLAKAGLPPIRFHDLRHTAASLALAQGVQAKVVQERLGHSSIALTMDVYSHVLPGMQEEAALAMDAILKRRTS